MAVYVQLLYHVVIATAHHDAVLDKPKREELFRFIWNVVKERRCSLLRIGGVDNHLHLLLAVHPAVAIGELVPALLRSSAEWIGASRAFPRFKGWDPGYTALSCSWEEKEMLVDAIKHQEEHHQEVSFREEYEELLERAGLKIAESDRVWLEDAEEEAGLAGADDLDE
jgi:putative transposase